MNEIEKIKRYITRTNYRAENYGINYLEAVELGFEAERGPVEAILPLRLTMVGPRATGRQRQRPRRQGGGHE